MGFQPGNKLSKGRPKGAINRSTEMMKLSIARAKRVSFFATIIFYFIPFLYIFIIIAFLSSFLATTFFATFLATAFFTGFIAMLLTLLG